MDMSSMDMGGMSTGAGIPTFFQFQQYYWAIVGTVIAVATVANIFNLFLAKQRLLDKSSTPAQPKSILFQTYATITAITREVANVALQPVKLGNYTLHLAPIGPVSLVLANLLTILTMMFYGFDTVNWVNWENIGYRTGFMTICQLPLVILLAGKQNIIGLFTGSSYEQLNWYHRWVSRTLWLSATIHMAFWFRDYGRFHYIVTMLKTDYYTQHGFAAWIILSFIFLTSFAPVRRWNYEFFVVQHIVTMAGFLAAVYLHATDEVRFWVWIPIGFKQRPFFANQATLTPLPGNVTRITVQDPLIKWNPGQHVFLSCHSVAPLQSHPFTIMSLPSDNKLEFLVRAEKGGTRRFFRFATKHSALLGETQSSDTSKRAVFIEGPYGSVRPLRQFDSVVLFAGGMGCTYTLPLMRDIVRAWKQEPQRTMRLAAAKRIRFIWVIKSRSQLSWVEPELQSVLQDIQDLKQQHPDTDKEVEISIYLTCDEALEKSTHPTTTVLAQRSSTEVSRNENIDEKKTLEPENVVRPVSSTSKSSGTNEPSGCGVTRKCCCTTTIENEDDISFVQKCNCSGAAEKVASSTSSSPSTTSLVHMKGFKAMTGRPHPRSIIHYVLEQAEGESAVVVCGPRGLAADVRQSVVALSDERAVHKGTGAQGIYLHVENFGL
uniref:ferric-chelate reductase (NADPH) n=1 Tax=Talaromyces marneffei PM1 TaxID=1077442 RepID=A0A093V8B0_TALMA